MFHLELRLFRYTAAGAWQEVTGPEGALVVDEGDVLAFEIRNPGPEPVAVRLIEKRFHGHDAAFFPLDGKPAMLEAGGVLTVGKDDGAAVRLRAPAAVIAGSLPPGGEGVLTHHELGVRAHAHAGAGASSRLHVGLPFAVRHLTSPSVEVCSALGGMCAGDLVPAGEVSMTAQQQAVIEALTWTGATVTALKPRLVEPGWSGSVAVSAMFADFDSIARAPDPTRRGGTVEMRVPAPAPGRGQFLVTTLEQGLVWSLPQRDETGADVFSIAEGLVPGFFHGITHSFEFALSAATAEAAGLWERQFGAYRLRIFGSGVDDYRTPGANAVTDADWQAANGKRVLVFLHGFIDRSYLAFRDLPPDLMSDLLEKYGSRVFAFDHPTMTVDPEHNAQALIDLIPAGVHVDLDLVCHSRGGLVARELNENPAYAGKVTVKKIVFAGTPNAGTPAAASNQIDRLFSALSTMMLKRSAPGPLGGAVTQLVSSIQRGLGAVAQTFTANMFQFLPGLLSMDPARRAAKNAHVDTRGAQYFTVGANYEPAAGSPGEEIAQLGSAFYNVPNDLVVPTYSVAYAATYAGGQPPPQPLFPLGAPPIFFAHRAVYHDTLFAQKETHALLRAQLVG